MESRNATSLGVLVAALAVATTVEAQPWRGALDALEPVPAPAERDWLIEPPARRAGVFRGQDPRLLILDNGLIRREFLLEPNVACVGFSQLTTGEQLVRAVGPECEVTIDDEAIAVGGLRGQPVGNYILPEWFDRFEIDPAALAFQGFETGPIEQRFGWKKRREWMASDAPWPPEGVRLTLRFASAAASPKPIEVDVHYVLYDAIPVVSKWFTLRNAGPRPITINTFASERLAMVEAGSEVEAGGRLRLPNVHVETDFTTVSMSGKGSQRQTVRWLTDASYLTQVSYQRLTRCLLECRPPLGPATRLEPGERFESFRTWILAFDGTDEKRRGLALARMYRTIAPWVAENPLIFHVRTADPPSIRAAISQAADVGFELIIMTFGSGFNIENRSPEYVEQIRSLAAEAHERGVALGGYSLLASRSVSPGDDVINPETGKPGGFATFGNSPCVGSAWGERYVETLYAFFEETGCDVLEHDGSYPGDACASTTHPGHHGYEDSRWAQWRVVTEFYRWCRQRGVYLNVPDWYFLNGASKTGMGYRETNWSLPRAQQEIIERQNIADGTRFKTPTMGWMFVPLTQYHGGGEAATIEPLHEHLDHYERRLQNLLGAGVQACFRGPRLYDTPQTRAMVRRWVDWYKAHRPILDSDLIVLRRADGRDWDGWLHVNPSLDERALAAIYNPLPTSLVRTISLPLRYAGVTGSARVRINGGAARTVALSRDDRASIELEIPARGFVWIVVEGPVSP
ncbi:MAG: alpha-galactosidase [Planctomycetes bacterium]|nr:alpha-galactosidase [Planctomycetota bacterium]